MRKKPKQLKEFLEKEKIKNKYEEKIIVKNDSAFVKLLFFFYRFNRKIIKNIILYINNCFEFNWCYIHCKQF